MPLYRILPGRTFGIYQAGEIVEHEAQDAAPYVGTHLEEVTKEEAKAGPPLPPPLARFADMNAADTLENAKSLTVDERAALLAWERAGKARITVISALEAE